MSDRLACVILDALGPVNIKTLGMDYINELYKSDEYTSKVFGISGLAHTPISNPRIWGDYVNDEKIWVQNHPYRWTGGIDGFDPILQNQDEDVTLYHRDDLKTNFVWDVLDHRGFNPCALGIPVCLPPYYYNADMRLQDAWFPHTPEALEEHIRVKPKMVEHHAINEYDFIACSIKAPDQWIHAKGGDIIDDDFIKKEVPVLENKVKEMIEVLESKDYDWMIFGDHGSPCSGRTANHKSKKLLTRHMKESIIISNLDGVPRYSGDMYEYILDYFGAEDVEELLEWEESPAPGESNQKGDIDTIMEKVKISQE